MVGCWEIPQARKCAINMRYVFRYCTKKMLIVDVSDPSRMTNSITTIQ